MATRRELVKYEDTTGAGVTVPAGVSAFGFVSLDGDSTFEMDGNTYTITADIPVNPPRVGGQFSAFTLTKGATASKVECWVIR